VKISVEKGEKKKSEAAAKSAAKENQSISVMA